MKLIICEGGQESNLHPLTLTRPTYDLKCGIDSLMGKITRAYGQHDCGLAVRGYLADLVAEEHPGCSVNQSPDGGALVVNGRTLWDDSLTSAIPIKGAPAIFKSGEAIIAARLTAEQAISLNLADPLGNLAADFPTIEVEAGLINWPWDLVHHNPDQIIADALASGLLGQNSGQVHSGAHLLAPESIGIATRVKVAPGVVLDAEGGPIILDEGAIIFANSVIEGPTYIGKNSAIKIGAKIYEGTSIGEVCKVGGEVEESIIHSYSNKQHDGFLGHAYLGQWVNLGADTNNSDLKNDYGPVKVEINGETVNSGSMFVGSTIGDHSKTGIGTMLNTGAVVGVGCNIYGAGLMPKNIPSFSWGDADKLVEYRLDKFLKVAQAVMARREKTLSAAGEAVLREVAKATEGERKKFL